MIQSVERALDILEELSRIKDKSKGIGVLELSRLLKLKSPTVHNLLKTLVYRDYVEKVKETNKYRLGANCYNLVKEELISNKLIKVAEPSILSLNRKINESIVLAVYRQGKRLTLSRVESQQPLKVDVDFSVDYNIYVTATGRILLSQLEDKELKNYVKEYGFPGKKWKGINDFKSLKEELTKIKKEKIVFLNKLDAQITVLAVPITGKNKDLNASLGLYLPLIRFKGKHKREVLKGLKDTAEEISSKLSY